MSLPLGMFCITHFLWWACPVNGWSILLVLDLVDLTFFCLPEPFTGHRVRKATTAE